jgi:hypothetical protein
LKNIQKLLKYKTYCKQGFLPTLQRLPRLPFLPPRHGNGTGRSKPLGFKKKSNLNKNKNAIKIPKNISGFIESNDVNFFQK